MIGNMLQTAASGGLLTVIVLAALAAGYARALGAGRKAYWAILAAALLSLPASQLLPEGSVFRTRIADSVTTLFWGILILLPVLGYAGILLVLRRRNKERLAPPEQNPSGLRIVEDDEALASEIEGRIAAWKASQGIPPGTRFSVMNRDARGEVTGAARARVVKGLLELEQLWVDEAARGAGLGGRLLEAAEAEARTRGAVRAAARLLPWQADGFMERRGYAPAHELPLPGGGAWRIYVKELG